MTDKIAKAVERLSANSISSVGPEGTFRSGEFAARFAAPELAAVFVAAAEMRRCDKDARTATTGEFRAAYEALDAALQRAAEKVMQ